MTHFDLENCKAWLQASPLRHRLQHASSYQICSCLVQVEFGAHQVVLVREKGKQLPEALQQSKALVMTVPQSKVIRMSKLQLDLLPHHAL